MPSFGWTAASLIPTHPVAFGLPNTVVARNAAAVANNLRAGQQLTSGAQSTGANQAYFSASTGPGAQSFTPGQVPQLNVQDRTQEILKKILGEGYQKTLNGNQVTPSNRGEYYAPGTGPSGAHNYNGQNLYLVPNQGPQGSPTMRGQASRVNYN